jgi:hypothetical protein
LREAFAVRLPREVLLLTVLLALAMAGVLAYVIYRRAHPPPPRPAAVQTLPPPAAAPAVRPPPATVPTTAPVPANPPVDLTQHDGQTLDFSPGHAVVKQTAADRAALAEGVKDITEATKDVTFGPSDAAPAANPPAGDPPPKK